MPQEEWSIGLELWAKEYLKGEGECDTARGCISDLDGIEADLARLFVTGVAYCAEAGIRDSPARRESPETLSTVYRLLVGFYLWGENRI